MEIRLSQFVQQTASMDPPNMGGTPCATSLEGCQHSHHLQKRRPDRMWYLPRYISSCCRGKDLCSGPNEQTLKTHHPRGGACDAVRLSFKPKHSRHDLLPKTTPGKVHRAGSTSVYCLSRLHTGIQHHCGSC